MATQTDFRIPVDQRVPEHIIAELARIIAETFDPDKIILFGSYAYGEPEPFSDVDILVVMDTDKDNWQHAQAIREILPARSFGLDILVRSQSELDRRIGLGDWFLKEIVTKGKLVYERGYKRVDI